MRSFDPSISVISIPTFNIEADRLRLEIENESAVNMVDVENAVELDNASDGGDPT